MYLCIIQIQIHTDMYVYMYNIHINARRYGFKLDNRPDILLTNTKSQLEGCIQAESCTEKYLGQITFPSS